MKYRVFAVILALFLLCGCAASPQTATAPTPSEHVSEPTLTQTEPTEPPTEPTEAPTEPTETETEPPTEPLEALDAAEITQRFALWHASQVQETQLLCVGNRPYVCLRTLSELFGAELPRAVLETELDWPLLREEEDYYISLVDACRLYWLEAIFDGNAEAVHLCRLADQPWPVTDAANDAQTAYLRLEDVMADFGLNGRFTHERLLKLRLLGLYLHDHADAFYIAWIPLYKNPGQDVENDVSRDFCFYNVDFVYTLDRLVGYGGRLGLHGLTHQAGSDVSADGFEFGKYHTYSREGLIERFDAAKEICARLGYDYWFFEFPHYALTDFKAEVAESQFDAIYQQYEHAAVDGQIETRTVDGHTCLWVPTPADYVDGVKDLEGVCSRLRRDVEKGKLASLFFHPVVDDASLQKWLDGATLCYAYDETGCIPTIVSLLEELGYRFGPF